MDLHILDPNKSDVIKGVAAYTANTQVRIEILSKLTKFQNDLHICWLKIYKLDHFSIPIAKVAEILAFSSRSRE